MKIPHKAEQTAQKKKKGKLVSEEQNTNFNKQAPWQWEKERSATSTFHHQARV